VDARQDDRENPFGMDTACERCSALCETRERVVHGYGDVTGDFLFVGTAPDAAADRSGVPFAGTPALYETLADLGLCPADDAAALAADTVTEEHRPAVENVYLTHLTRCRHPEREPTDEEVRTCEDYLTAEIRHINPELLVPVGERALAAIATEYTTRAADAFALPADNGRSIRGRGFEIVPMVDPELAAAGELAAFAEAFEELTAGDYRQTKGRRER
jgi:uracil-DNA glycosylase